MSLRIIYAAGPGNVLGTYTHWKRGHDDPSEVSVTYSGQFFDYCRRHGHHALIVGRAGSDLWKSWRAAATAGGDNGRAEGERFQFINQPTPLGSARGLLYHLGQILAGLRLVVAALRYRADAAVVDAGTTYWFALLPLAVVGTAIVPTVHCTLWPEARPPRGLRRFILWLNGRAIRTFPALLSASPEITRQIDTATGGRLPPVLQFLPTYRRQDFQDVPPPSMDGPFRVLFAGRIESDKGVFHLLEMARRLKAEGLGQVEFDVCGSGGSLDDLRRQVAAAGLADRFRCHGRLSRAEMREMYVAARAVIVPTTTSFVEGFNQVVAEGVLACRPVITSRVCPAIEYVADAVACVPPDDVAAYAEAIKRLATDAEYYEQKRGACLRLREQFFDVALGWEAALEQAMSPITGAAPEPTVGPRETI